MYSYDHFLVDGKVYGSSFINNQRADYDPRRYNSLIELKKKQFGEI